MPDTGGTTSVENAFRELELLLANPKRAFDPTAFPDPAALTVGFLDIANVLALMVNRQHQVSPASVLSDALVDAREQLPNVTEDKFNETFTMSLRLLAGKAPKKPCRGHLLVAAALSANLLIGLALASDMDSLYLLDRVRDGLSDASFKASRP